MNNKSTEDVSFPSDRKESFKQRLLQLIGNRSVRAAAIEWGLSVSTLNNYITKGTEPALKAVQLIANKERVSLDWLAGDAPNKDLNSNLSNETVQVVHVDTSNEASKLANAWMDIFHSLSTDEAQRLIRLFHRKGIENAIQLLLASTPASHEQDDVDAALEAIEKLQTRNTLKGTLRSVLLMGLENGNAEIDREILDGIESIKRAQAPGEKDKNLTPAFSEHKKIG
jgi:hypothetical protein